MTGYVPLNKGMKLTTGIAIPILPSCDLDHSRHVGLD
jgi:hypothetical protein